MRETVIDAAIACILERGLYRSSSNEIARRAGVTWGVIQHYFGTRERLMLAVLERGGRRYTDRVDAHKYSGVTTEERISSFLDLLSSLYTEPEYVVYLQVLLNFSHDPSTSAETRRSIYAVTSRSQAEVMRHLRDAIGPTDALPQLEMTILMTLRGYCLSELLSDTMGYGAPTLQTKRAITRQRKTLVDVVSSFLDDSNAGITP